MAVELMEHQKEAVASLDNGRILYGGVGSGKSITALAYYMAREQDRDIYIITTAKKRDSLEWMGEASSFGIGPSGATVAGVLTIDSWHNLSKYQKVEGAFFIFDEQRLSGYGAWVRSFLRIAKNNRWILLTATPGDTWLDYAPVFIANGWYKNITDFKLRHVVYEPYIKFPRVKGYLEEERLERLRSEILVEMPYMRHTTRYMNWLDMGHDEELWNAVVRRRWNPWENRPIRNVSELFYSMRRVANSHPSRLEMTRKMLMCHDRLVIFYNFNYELESLRTLAEDVAVAEWNGHKHEEIPKSSKWVYLVQYASGSEGWNCTETDAMILHSLTYSYKMWSQSMGRIDRLDTSYVNLFYYIFIADLIIDRKIREALAQKRSFNEREMLVSDDSPWRGGGFAG